MKKEMILGISSMHGGGLCLLDIEGNIVISLAEERLSRNKNELGFPIKSLKYVIDNVDTDAIKYIAIGSTYVGMDLHQIEKYQFSNYEQLSKIFKNPLALAEFYTWTLINKKVATELDKKNLFVKILKQYGLITQAKKVHLIDHHLAYAASAYYCSDIENALIITIDAMGDGKSASINNVIKHRLNNNWTLDEKGSIGVLYHFITAALGFRAGRHEGKVTGLAAYGKPEVFGAELGKYFKIKNCNDNILFENLINQKVKINFLLNLHKFLFTYFKWIKKNESYEELEKRFTWIVDKAIFNKLFDNKYSREDIAAGVQYILEDRVCKFIDFYLKKYNCKNLCLAGGVFANVKLNQRLFNLPGVENIYIHPGMGDEGLALGAAYQVLSKINPNFKRKVIQTVSLGPGYFSDEIKVVLDKEGIKYCQLEDVNKLAQLTAKYISEGKIIGFFNGRMEYGSRALGSRSVLADPRKKEMHSILNDRMKRTEFMPFAPVIPYELTYDILEGKIKGSEHAAEFMTITYDVKKEWQAKIPAVVHVDGTARPQLIKRENNSLYYDIVTEFGQITGVPVIINTSFNIHEEPIVCTPEDAIRSFKQNCVDIMVMEDIVVGEE